VLSGAEDKRLEISVMTMGADCQQFTDVDVYELDQSVEIRAWVEELPADGCYAARLYNPVTVTLAAPLSDRTLLGCIEVSPPHDTRESCAEIVDL